MTKKQGYQELLELRVLDFIRERHLLAGKDRLLVAVSGGQDSVCLLHTLSKLQNELKVKLHVAHLNHQLRGKDSVADAHYVAELAGQFGIPATIEQRDVKAYQDQHRTSPEEAAREVRYNFLAEVAKAIGTTLVATGHTTDDNVETILMHLIRGTGTRGLRGLQASSRWQSSSGSVTIIRPLLQVSRQETADYCHNHRLVPVLDTSNLTLSTLRNRIRHQLMPMLQSYNPRVVEAILRTARIAADDLAFLEGEGSRLWGKVAQRQSDTIILEKERLLRLPPAMQRYMLRAAIEELLGNLKDIETRHIEEIMAALAKPAGKSLSLPGGITFTIEYDRYLLSLDTAALSPLPVLKNETSLNIPGTTEFPGWIVEATVTEPPTVKSRHATASASSKMAPLPVKDITSTKDSYTAFLDYDKTGDELMVRCRKAGDRFQPLGMSQSKLLGEFMIDAKIPRAWRQRVPIVCSNQHILWIVGWRIDDRIKVTENTRQVLRLEFNRIPGTTGVNKGGGN